MRSNRSTQHWTMTQRQGGQACPQYRQRGVRGPSADLVGAGALRCRGAARTGPGGRRPRRTPPPVAWPLRYEFRFVEGGWPDFHDPRDLPDSRTVLWVRDDPPRPLDAQALAAMADVFYPRVFRRRQRMTPAGTVSLTTYFHAEAAALAAQGERPLLAVAHGRRFTQGFYDQSAELWSDDGHLLASSHQVVYYKG